MKSGFFAFLIVLSALLALAGCKNPNKPTPPPTGNGSLTLTFVGDGRPLTDIAVSLWGFVQSDQAGSGNTDSNGRIVFTDLPYGKYEIRVMEAFGYKKGTLKEIELNQPEVSVSVDVPAADDIELDEIWTESIGVVDDGDTILYPTLMIARGRYRAVTYPWPQKAQIVFHFKLGDRSFGAAGPSGNRGGPISTDRWERVIPDWIPGFPSGTTLFEEADTIVFGMGSPPGPTGSGNTLVMKEIKTKLFFQRR